jgi:hypothetical protein
MDISTAVLKRALREDHDRVAMDSQMLSVLLEIDGVRQVAEVGQALGMSPATVCEVARRLMDARLVAPARAAVRSLEQGFLDFLERQLAVAIGPIAPIVMEECAAEIGYDLHIFPVAQGAQLIERVAREVQRQDKKLAFKQTMLQHLKAVL